MHLLRRGFSQDADLDDNAPFCSHQRKSQQQQGIVRRTILVSSCVLDERGDEFCFRVVVVVVLLVHSSSGKIGDVCT